MVYLMYERDLLYKLFTRMYSSCIF